MKKHKTMKRYANTKQKKVSTVIHNKNDWSVERQKVEWCDGKVVVRAVNTIERKNGISIHGLRFEKKSIV
jgi:nitrogenase subunit NifH